MNFASAGIGSTSHLAAERFRLSAGIRTQHVPFRGPNEAFTEVMAVRGLFQGGRAARLMQRIGIKPAE